MLFPFLLKRAMKMGSKSFGKVNTKKHAVMSRGWMWRHVWSPMMTKMRESPNKVDDNLISFIYYNQSCALCDGEVQAILSNLIREASTNNHPDTIICHVNALRIITGLDKLDKTDEE